jgi:hypothetical protein
MEFRDRFNKALGLFVEMPAGQDGRIEAPHSDDASATPEPQVQTVEELVRQSDGPNLDEISVADAGIEVKAGSDGSVDFGPVYRKASLPDAPFTAEQMLDLLGSLPSDLPIETRRQTVKVTLGTMGKSIGATQETIVADASRKLAALTSYAGALSGETKERVAAAEKSIQDLQNQIEAQRRDIAAAKSSMESTLEFCRAESNRLDDVLEFFSLDIPPSKLSS